MAEKKKRERKKAPAPVVEPLQKPEAASEPVEATGPVEIAITREGLIAETEALDYDRAFLVGSGPGPSETTIDKGADELLWFCPHCETRYPKDAKIARANHLARVHPGA